MSRAFSSRTQASTRTIVVSVETSTVVIAAVGILPDFSNSACRTSVVRMTIQSSIKSLTAALMGVTPFPAMHIVASDEAIVKTKTIKR